MSEFRCQCKNSIDIEGNPTNEHIIPIYNKLMHNNYNNNNLCNNMIHDIYNEYNYENN